MWSSASIWRFGRLNTLAPTSPPPLLVNETLGNRLSSLPSSVGNLKSLETLELSDNTIRSLPESIGRLKRLGTLTLSNNGLTGLPESLGGLSSVKLLDLSRNAITRVPGGLSSLGALTSLDMRENRLTEVPPLPRGDRLAQVCLVCCSWSFGAAVIFCSSLAHSRHADCGFREQPVVSPRHHKQESRLQYCRSLCFLLFSLDLLQFLVFPAGASCTR